MDGFLNYAASFMLSLNFTGQSGVIQSGKTSQNHSSCEPDLLLDGGP